MVYSVGAAERCGWLCGREREGTRETETEARWRQEGTRGCAKSISIGTKFAAPTRSCQVTRVAGSRKSKGAPGKGFSGVWRDRGRGGGRGEGEVDGKVDQLSAKRMLQPGGRSASASMTL